MTQSLRGPSLLDYLTKVQGPVRLKDLVAHPDYAGLPADLPPVKTFLGTPIYHRTEHVGNLYLTEKEGGQEFTQEDEDMAAMFAARAASAISNSRRYEEAHQAKVDLETLMDISPVAVSAFDARIGEITYMNQESRRMLGAMALPEEVLDNVFDLLTFTRDRLRRPSRYQGPSDWRDCAGRRGCRPPPEREFHDNLDQLRSPFL